MESAILLKVVKGKKSDASDSTMKDVVLRDILFYLKEYKDINKILFTGGSSKNSPEYFWKSFLKKII